MKLAVVALLLLPTLSSRAGDDLADLSTSLPLMAAKSPLSAQVLNFLARPEYLFSTPGTGGWRPPQPGSIFAGLPYFTTWPPVGILLPERPARPEPATPAPPVEPDIDPGGNRAPVGTPDTYGNNWAGQSVLANDTDPDGNQLEARLIQSDLPSEGELTIDSETGIFDFTPYDPEFSGQVFFGYKPSDGSTKGNRTGVTFWLGDVLVEPDIASVDEPGSAARVDYSEPVVTYSPTLPNLGDYSLPDVCRALPRGAATVTLQNRERLEDAYTRLLAASGRQGGTIEIPWNVDTVQCDSISISKDRVMSGMPLTLRGIPGPNGEQPRFYCRSVEREGSIPKGNGTFIRFANGPDGVLTGANHLALIENLHIDGYGDAVYAPNSGTFIFRNNYLHHTYGNAILNNFVEADWTGYGAELEFCGNEISHVGLGNYKHGFYLHTSLNEVEPIKVTLVDNLIHSCNGSSCFKSTANDNTLVNNEFYKSLATDPGFETKYSGMLVDYMACSQAHIEGNLFHRFAPPPNVDAAGGVMIGIRNRKRAFGCNSPPSFEEVKLGVAEPVSDSEFWKPGYWASLAGEIIFKSTIKDNRFVHEGFKEGEAIAITDWGTYPNQRSDAFGPACLLAPPAGWYERHRTYLTGNTFTGLQEPAYIESAPEHNEDKCGRVAPLVDLRDYDLVEASGNTYN